ncbi:hypothetical protein ARMGADRAFT_1039703 [Armillaria gallica]|uniref:Uncharacterized protein n=1 Tax=Armillaria gallica TaxID=47427 RepID=A0A2H3CR54_ARMGA|nr:hypothetical protein ARMGADRAFT_1039703 [Armillaria gallica]
MARNLHHMPLALLIFDHLCLDGQREPILLLPSEPSNNYIKYVQGDQIKIKNNASVNLTLLFGDPTITVDLKVTKSNNFTQQTKSQWLRTSSVTNDEGASNHQSLQWHPLVSCWIPYNRRYTHRYEQERTFPFEHQRPAMEIVTPCALSSKADFAAIAHLGIGIIVEHLFMVFPWAFVFASDTRFQFSQAGEHNNDDNVQYGLDQIQYDGHGSSL